MFFTLNERDVKPNQSGQAKKDTSEFREKHSQYGKQGPKQNVFITKEIIKDKTTVSLGQILCHLFEKAINVQYQEFQNKLSNQMKEFFFSTNENNLFNQDLKLAKFWKDLSPEEQSNFWLKIFKSSDEVVQQIKQSELFKKVKQFDDIQEETETENSSFSNGKTNLNFSKKINSKYSNMVIDPDSNSQSDNWNEDI